MALAAFGCNKNQGSKPGLKTGFITVGTHKVKVQLAESEAEQSLGLGGRHFLASDDGMLFIFAQSGQRSFWMKDMMFPLDFIWISNAKVVQITANAPSEPNVSDENLKIYTPSQSVDSVLEVNAGWAADNKIKVGDEARLTR